MLSNLANNLWGNQSRFTYLFLAAIILLFSFLGGHEIWTQEHRWADIVSGMFYRHDFLHPYLGDKNYYDKPLLSYWLIALFALLSDTLTTWALRLPSALSGLLAVWSIYRLGTALKDKQLGLLSGWLLLTTFYFIFWARTSSADMLNLAGSLFAIAWYFTHRRDASFFDYAVFFMIIAVTSLCKGLVGAVIPIIAVATDIVLQKSWKQHLRLSIFLAALPALVVYLLPFWISSYIGGDAYGENGLYLVYRENVLRYFQPFDHKGPLYTYFVYLPLYMLPSTLFFFPALLSLIPRWKTLTVNSKWIVWTFLLIFLFFTLSGSRRSYYVLPLVPLAILLTADWLLSAVPAFARRQSWAVSMIGLTFILLFTAVDVLPAWYYSQFGVSQFAQHLQQEATKSKPWTAWNIVMLDAESKLNFYLQLPPDTTRFDILHSNRNKITSENFANVWPILINKPANTIFITRKLYMTALQPFFMGYRVIEMPSHSSWSFLEKNAINNPIAYIPL